jgi:hypothetical protein
VITNGFKRTSKKVKDGSIKARKRSIVEVISDGLTKRESGIIRRRSIVEVISDGLKSVRNGGRKGSILEILADSIRIKKSSKKVAAEPSR